MLFILAYLLTVVLINLGFSSLPFIPTPLGVVPVMSLFVGLVFIFRDYAQRQSGHNVLWAMGIACVLSWVFGDPQVVVASVAAFAISEIADFAVYTVTKKPFHQRVLISSAIAVPLDSIVFLALIGVINPAAMLAMSFSKITASVILWIIYEVRERRSAYANR